MSELLEIIISAIDNASSVFDDIGNSAQDSGSTLQSAFEEATSEVERLEQELADIEMGNIEGDFEAVSAQLQQAQAEADALEQEFIEADQAASQMGDDLGIINSSMLMQLGEQVGNLGSQAEGMAQDMNQASISVGQLATQTGIAEPQMVNLINTISNATFPNDEAMMYVKSLDQIGVSSENLGKSATDLDRINDAFGLGAQTTNSLGQELSVLGVDMNNVSSSFNALAYANANTVGGMQNYYNFLRKFDAEFNQLGLDVDQSSIIIAAATKKFGGGKAAFSGLSEALKECGGDTRKLEESLGLAAGSLDNASQITGEYEGQLQDLANEEAEHKTLLDQIGAAWEDMSLSIGSIASPLMGVVGLFGQMGQFGLQVRGIKELLTTFKGLKTAVMEYEFVQNLASIATGVYGTIVGIVTGEIGLAEAATMAWNAVLAMNPVVWVIAALVALVAIIYEVGKAFGWWKDVGGMIDAIWAGINKLWSAFINHPDVQAAISAISGAISVLWGWIQQAGQAILDFFGISTSGDFDVVQALIDGIGNAWNMLKQALSPVITAIQAVIGAFNQFRSGQMDLPQFIWSVLTILGQMYVTIFTRIGSFVVSIGIRLVRAGVNAARNFVLGIITRLRQLPGRVFSALIAVVSRIISAGAQWVSTVKQKALDVVNGAYNTLTSLPGKIASALSGVVDAITQPFKKGYEDAKKWWDKMTQLKMPNFYAGEPLDITGSNSLSISSSDNGPIIIEDNINLTVDLKNIPAGMSADTLITALQDKNVLNALVSNRDFQSLDAQVKQKISLKKMRSGGI